ncbi:MAG: type II toxin-antitoxin system VapC family toxin [Candidatus Rokuibacteriota bacterium]
MSFLLDTNVISEVRKPDGDRNVQTWIAAVSADDLYLSVLVVGEIRQGVERLRRRDARRAGAYESWLGRLQRDYADRIIPITEEIAQEWGRLNVPDPLPVIDGLMAATAKVRGMTLVTRDTADIARTGVHVLNPFARAR